MPTGELRRTAGRVHASEHEMAEKRRELGESDMHGEADASMICCFSSGRASESFLSSALKISEA